MAVVFVAVRPRAPAFTSAPLGAERDAVVLDVAMGGVVDISGTVALFEFRFRCKGLADACTSCCGCCCCLCVDATTDDTIAAKTLPTPSVLLNPSCSRFAWCCFIRSSACRRRIAAHPQLLTLCRQNIVAMLRPRLAWCRSNGCVSVGRYE